MIHIALLPRMYVPLAARIWRGGSAQISDDLFAAVNVHHINVKHCQTLDQAPFRPVLYALLHMALHDPPLHAFTRLASTDVSRLPYDLACCDLLHSGCDVARSAGKIFIHISPNIGLWYGRGGGEQWRSPSLQALLAMKLLWNYLATFFNKIVIYAG